MWNISVWSWPSHLFFSHSLSPFHASVSKFWIAWLLMSVGMFICLYVSCCWSHSNEVRWRFNRVFGGCLVPRHLSLSPQSRLVTGEGVQGLERAVSDIQAQGWYSWDLSSGSRSAHTTPPPVGPTGARASWVPGSRVGILGGHLSGMDATLRSSMQGECPGCWSRGVGGPGNGSFLSIASPHGPLVKRETDGCSGIHRAWWLSLCPHLQMLWSSLHDRASSLRSLLPVVPGAHRHGRRRLIHVGSGEDGGLAHGVPPSLVQAGLLSFPVPSSTEPVVFSMHLLLCMCSCKMNLFGLTVFNSCKLYWVIHCLCFLTFSL